MNIEDLFFVNLNTICPTQYEVRLEDGTKVGYVKHRGQVVECHPYKDGEIDVKRTLVLQEYVEYLDDDLMVKCGKALCDFYNKKEFLAFFNNC